MIDRFSSERKGELPTPEQLEEYYELLRHTLHTIGRGIRRTSNYPGKEGLLPGWLDTLDGDSESLRHRSYAASMRRLGETGATLAVAENDHTLLPNPQGGSGGIALSEHCINLPGTIGLAYTKAEHAFLISLARRAVTLKCCHDVLMMLLSWR